MSKINKEWHRKNPVPKNASLKEERIRWHLEHAKNCGCRPIPESILLEIKDKR